MKWTWCLIVAVVFAGCGGTSTSPVVGVVLLDGKPAADLAVQFVPQSESGHDATGQTDKNGEFTMSTFKPKDGVVPGEYKVILSALGTAADTNKYATAEEAMTAAAGKAATKPGPPPFPEKYTRADQTPFTQKVPVSGKLKLELSSK